MTDNIWRYGRLAFDINQEIEGLTRLVITKIESFPHSCKEYALLEDLYTEFDFIFPEIRV
jgi:hypothetical protein